MLPVLSTIATLVGGAMVNGTAEIMMNPTQGFVWAQAPVYFIVGLPLGLYLSLIFVSFFDHNLSILRWTTAAIIML